VTSSCLWVLAASATLALTACAPEARVVQAAPNPDASLSAPLPSSTTAPVTLPPVAALPKGPVPSPTHSGTGAGLEAPSLELPLATALEPLARGLPELAPFYDRLEELRAGRRLTPVRVLWLGDSHTAADFMTEKVRARLFEVAGDGGPGFISLGLDAYRHGAARVEKFGKWRHQPILPAQRTRVLDGVFGYAGQRTIPLAGAEARVELRTKRVGEDMRWTLLTRLEPGDALEVVLDGQTTIVRAHELVEIGGQSDSFVAPATASFVLRHRAGDPQVFGVVVESVRPGAVLDTVGINGARVATPLAWGPQQYQARVRQRQPDLAVLAYGTNEAFDNTAPEKYADHYRELVGRLRAAVPDLSCWVIGAPDAATRDGRSVSRLAPLLLVQQSVARELGCAFTSAQALMGGSGGFQRWLTASPPLARGDRIHLSILGYQTLGQDLALALLPRARVQPALSPEQP